MTTWQNKTQKAQNLQKYSYHPRGEHTVKKSKIRSTSHKIPNLKLVQVHIMSLYHTCKFMLSFREQVTRNFQFQLDLAIFLSSHRVALYYYNGHVTKVKTMNGGGSCHLNPFFRVLTYWVFGAIHKLFWWVLAIFGWFFDGLVYVTKVNTMNGGVLLFESFFRVLTYWMLGHP